MGETNVSDHEKRINFGIVEHSKSRINRVLVDGGDRVENKRTVGRSKHKVQLCEVMT